MPIYEYRCQTCGEQFEKLIRSLSQVPREMSCPECQSREVQRVLSARFDGMFDAAHLLKLASYGAMLTGLLVSLVPALHVGELLAFAGGAVQRIDAALSGE